MILAACLGAGFVAVLLAVRAGGALVLLDGMVQAGLAPLRIRPVVAAFDWLTQMGTGAAGAAVLATASALLWSGGRAALVGPMWLAFVGAEATSWSVKFLTGRARPPFIEGLTAASPSFPSAHATVAVVAYGFIALTVAAGMPERRVEVLAVWVVLSALIGFSRLLLSFHYLSDVVGGALVGAAWLALAWRIASPS